MPAMSAPLAFVTCANEPAVLQQRLLASPCLAQGKYPLDVYFDAPSAAWAFNRSMEHGPACAWRVWVHQDVFLPAGWDVAFLQGLSQAEDSFPRAGVAGVYGIAGHGRDARRAGHILDRGEALREPTPLPCTVDSLDELLFAARADTGLRLDPALQFDFYATDLVLSAQAAGWQAVVVDAYCEHWSGTPRKVPFDPASIQRIVGSAAVFERKWAQRLPIETSCFAITRPGDVQRFIQLIS